MTDERLGPEDLSTRGVPSARRGYDKRVIDGLIAEAARHWKVLAQEHAELRQAVEDSGGLEFLRREMSDVAREVGEILEAAKSAADGMRSRLLLNAFLLLLAVGLGLVVIWEPGKEKPGEPVKLTALDPETISHIRIESRGREPVQLVKEHETWQLVLPLSLPANGFKAETLAKAAAATSHGQFPQEDRELAPFGLDPPRARLQLGDEELLFGDTEPLQGHRYVLANGMVHLITDRFYHHLMAGAPGFVHPAPLGPDPRPVAIKLPDAEARRSEGQWTALPQGLEVSADAVAALVEAWRHAQATSVKRADDALTPQGSVTIEFEESDTIRFEFARSESEVILVRTDLDLQYHLPKASGERLLRLAPAEAES